MAYFINSYQVRFALLQAGHYGTPQGRVRFFAVAAADGHPLPDMPQPTHDFPDPRNLQIKLPVGGPPIKPIQTNNGTAPHPFVTIDDAISDLPRFDWCDQIACVIYDFLILYTGDTPNRVANRLGHSARFENEQEKFPPSIAKLPLPTVGMKVKSNITTQRRRRIN